MSVEENKTTARRLIEAHEGMMGHPERIPAFIKDFFAPEFVYHTAQGDIHIEQFRQMEIETSIAFPDAKDVIDDIIAEGDKVVIRRTATGTHKGIFNGIAPTGKRINFESVDICRLLNGKVVEMWWFVNQMTILQQLGVIPAQK
jgi:predicted ester cyclase